LLSLLLLLLIIIIIIIIKPAPWFFNLSSSCHVPRPTSISIGNEY